MMKASNIHILKRGVLDLMRLANSCTWNTIFNQHSRDVLGNSVLAYVYKVLSQGCLDEGKIS